MDEERLPKEEEIVRTLVRWRPIPFYTAIGWCIAPDDDRAMIRASLKFLLYEPANGSAGAYLRTSSPDPDALLNVSGGQRDYRKMSSDHERIMGSAYPRLWILLTTSFRSFVEMCCATRLGLRPSNRCLPLRLTSLYPLAVYYSERQ